MMPTSVEPSSIASERRRQLRDVGVWLSIVALTAVVLAVTARSSNALTQRLHDWWPIAGQSPTTVLLGHVTAPLIAGGVLVVAARRGPQRWHWHTTLVLSYLVAFAWTASLHTNVDTDIPSNSTLASAWGIDLIDTVSGSRFGVALIICALSALTTPFILTTVRSLAGRTYAVYLAPVVALGPWAAWMSLGMDGINAMVVAGAVATAALATEPTRSRSSGRILATLAGLLLSLAVLLSYSAAWFGLSMLAIYFTRRRAGAIWCSAFGAVTTLAVIAAFDYSWPVELWTTYSGAWGALLATPVHLWWLGLTPVLAVVAAGPAVVSSLSRWSAEVWPLLVGPIAVLVFSPLMAAAVTTSNLSWVALCPWLVVAAVASRTGREDDNDSALISTGVGACAVIAMLFAG